MSLLSGGVGGFLVPYEFDPAIVIAWTGFVDPMREVARVETTLFNEKRFVTCWVWHRVVCGGGRGRRQLCRALAAGHRLQESDELRPGVLRAVRGLEYRRRGQPAVRRLQGERGSPCLHDRQRNNRAERAHHRPHRGRRRHGDRDRNNVLAKADLYINQAALPARWRPNAKWQMNLAIINGFRQLPQATGLNYSIVNDDGPRPKALGWEIFENNAMDSTLTGAAADYLVVSGDFQQYVIFDRIGATVEVIPQLMKAAFRPSGQRAFCSIGASAPTSSSRRFPAEQLLHVMAARKTTLVARAQFVAEIDGRTVVVLEGARYPADHPIVKGHPTLFEPAARGLRPDFGGRAAPNELRGFPVVVPRTGRFHPASWPRPRTSTGGLLPFTRRSTSPFFHRTASRRRNRLSRSSPSRRTGPVRARSPTLAARYSKHGRDVTPAEAHAVLSLLAMLSAPAAGRPGTRSP